MGEPVKIPLHSKKHPGLFALVDEEDAEKVMQYSWHPRVCRSTVYASSKIRGPDGGWTTVQLHRHIMGLTDRSIRVDHINHDGLDCRRENMRIASAMENARNQRKTSAASSRYKGVFLDTQRGLWKVQIRVNTRKTYLGRFDNEIDAALAYDEAARERFGEHACLNFPREGEIGALLEDG